MTGASVGAALRPVGPLGAGVTLLRRGYGGAAVVGSGMAKTWKQGRYSWPREYWSRRLQKAFAAWGRPAKRLTHRRERREARLLEREPMAGY